MNAHSHDVNTDHDDPLIGRVLADHYRIDAQLGRGGMGTVYRGMQLSVQRPVAIKVINAAAQAQAEHVERFKREAAAMAQLRHPNTVRLFDFGVTEHGQLFMVMELLEGEDLATLLERDGALLVANALGIVRQVAQSLSEAHALGIVHRDLKPGNIFLLQLQGGDSFVKVMDFGIVGFESEVGHSRLTMRGSLVGTPAYLSPEQAQGQDVDARADLYSLGIVLFETLTGRSPFDATTDVSLLVAHASQPPHRLAEVQPNLPQIESIQALLDRLLDKDPQARPASANEVIASLDAILTALVSAAGASGSPALALVLRSAAPAARKPARRAVHATGVGLVMAVALALLVWQLRTRDALAGAHALSAAAASALHTIRARVAESPKAARDGRLFSVTIASRPSGASVRMAGAELGKTPYELRLKNRTQLDIVLPGRASQTVTVEPDGEPNVVVQLAPLRPR